MTGEVIQEPLLPEGPGRRLREARTALKLSRDDVASALRLKPQIIYALEADDTSALPAPIYVNGYLRNYARLVGIPAEPLIEAYAQLDVEAPPVVSDIVQPADQRHSRLIVRGVSLLVFGAVLAGFLSWLQHQDIDWPGSDSQVEAITTPVETIDGMPEIVEQVPGLPAPVEKPGPDAVMVPELPVEEQAGASAIPAPESATDSVSPDAEALYKQGLRGKTGEVPAAVPQITRIVLRAAGDCWVEVTDAKGRRLVYDLVRAGQTLETRGSAPFKVFLGNAAAVTMEVNGQDYDFSQYISGKLARFTLTIEEDA